MADLERDLGRTLAALGGTSVVIGGVLAAAGRTPPVRAFGQQTAGWGAIDLALAGLGSVRPPADRSRLRRVLLVNAALDVGYVAVGSALALRPPTGGKKLTPAQVRAHGVAVVIQGAALFVLDSVSARRLK